MAHEWVAVGLLFIRKEVLSPKHFISVLQPYCQSFRRAFSPEWNVQRQERMMVETRGIKRLGY